MTKQFILFIVLLTLSQINIISSQPYYYFDKKVTTISSINFPDFSSKASCKHKTCEACLSCLNCVWCQTDNGGICSSLNKPFSCSKTGLILRKKQCKGTNQNICSNQDNCTSCLTNGCQWCDGDGAAYPHSCTPIGTNINCSFNAYHGGPGATCNCGAATNCSDCISTFGCGWCDGDGTSIYPSMCVNPNNPFGCSTAAWHNYGGSC